MSGRTAARRRALAIAAAAVVLAGDAGALAAPVTGVWTSRDGRVRLLHPAGVVPGTKIVAGNYFFARGWRVYWNGPDPWARTGAVVVSFAVSARPSQPHTSARELLQIGVSRDRRVVATCVHAGTLQTGGATLPDQTINGVTFAATSNSDQSMSQGTTTLDLRAVAGGACYAVDRITETADSDPDPAVTVPQSQAAADLDAIIGTIRLTP